MLRKTQVNCWVNRRHERAALLCDTGCSQKARRKEQVFICALFDNQISTGGETIPKASIYGINMELGKPVFALHCCSRSTVRKTVGNAGKGSLKKQILSCNGMDRGKTEFVVTANKVNASTRKGADFRQVWKRNTTNNSL